MVSDLDIGWMSGILDGEGSFCLVQSKGRARKSDGRYPISPRILMANTEISLLEKFTTILTELGIDYTYVYQAGEVGGSNSVGRVNINIHKIDSIIRFVPFVLSSLSCKKDRAKLIYEFALWKKENNKQLNKGDKSSQDEEYTFWDRYRSIYAGRGRALRYTREYDLRYAIMENSKPIHF